MSKELFTVRPVQHYEGAEYPAKPDPDEVLEEERPHPLTLLVGMILVIGISIGLIGCYLRTDHVPEPPEVQPDGGPDGDPPDPPECDEGELRCDPDVEVSYVETLETCDLGEWVAVDCNTICRQEHGAEYSWGCDAESDNPCECEYDIIEGEMMWCDPPQLYCIDDNTVEICDEDTVRTQSCSEYCREQLGDLAISLGCSDTADDPCQCELDILAGEPVMCTPGDITCLDDDILGICENEWDDWTMIECSDHCVETFGSEYVSDGCNIGDLENPCQCVPLDVDSGSGQ